MRLQHLPQLERGLRTAQRSVVTCRLTIYVIADSEISAPGAGGK